MRQCEKCGKVLTDDVGFCTNCGAAIAASQMNNNQFTNMGTQQNSMTAQQPNPVVQQLESNTVAGQMEVGAPKNNSNGKIIALAVACVICLTIGITGIVLAVMNMNKGDNKQVAVENGGSNGGGVVDVVSSGTKVEYAGYEFVIPDDFMYELFVDSEGLESLDVSKDDSEYLLSIMYRDDVTFAGIESNIDEITEVFKQEAPDTTSGRENVDGVDFVYFDIGIYKGNNVVYLMSKADLHCFMTAIMFKPGVDSQKYFKDAAEILSSAKKKSKMDRGIMNDDNGLGGVKSLSNKITE